MVGVYENGGERTFEEKAQIALDKFKADAYLIRGAIFENIQRYINSNDFFAFRKDNPTVAAQIGNLKAEDIIMGACPTIIFGHIEGDLTAVGADEGIERTVAMGFYSKTYMFSVDNEAEDFICAYAARYTEFPYAKRNGGSQIAKKAAKEVAKDEFYRVNLRMKEYRVNHFNWVPESSPLTIPLCSIFVMLRDKNGNVFKTRIGVCTFFNRNGMIVEEPTIDINVGKYLEGQDIYKKTSNKAKAKRTVIILLVLLAVGAVAFGIIKYIGMFS